MAIERAAIKDAIAETLEGRDRTRALATGVFKYGIHDGQTQQAQSAKLVNTIDARHWFDVRLATVRPHAATNVANQSSRRIVEMPVTIRIRTHLKTQPQESERDEVLDQVASDCEDAVQALAYPHNLDTTQDGRSTNIVGGLMTGIGNRGTPEWRQVNEDWERKRVESEITGNLIVAVEANT